MPSFFWDPDRRRYRYPSGRLVAPSAVKKALDRTLRNTARGVYDHSVALKEGRISLADWQEGMRGYIKDTHIYSMALARGGTRQLTHRDRGRLGPILKKQNQYLDRFAGQIERGEVKLDGVFLRRSTLYAHAGWATYETYEELSAREAGATQEKNVLDPTAEHCSSCVDETTRGWVPIGTLVPIGGRDCRVRDRCHLVYRKGGVLTADEREREAKRVHPDALPGETYEETIYRLVREEKLDWRDVDQSLLGSGRSRPRRRLEEPIGIDRHEVPDDVLFHRRGIEPDPDLATRPGPEPFRSTREARDWLEGDAFREWARGFQNDDEILGAAWESRTLGRPARALERAVTAPLDRDLVAYRGAPAPELLRAIRDGEDLVGRVLDHPDLLQVSLSDEVAKRTADRILFEVEIPRGTRVAAPDALLPPGRHGAARDRLWPDDDLALVLQRGTPLRIRSLERDADGFWRVRATVEAPGPDLPGRTPPRPPSPESGRAWTEIQEAIRAEGRYSAQYDHLLTAEREGEFRAAYDRFLAQEGATPFSSKRRALRFLAGEIDADGNPLREVERFSDLSGRHLDMERLAFEKRKGRAMTPEEEVGYRRGFDAAIARGGNETEAMREALIEIGARKRVNGESIRSREVWQSLRRDKDSLGFAMTTKNEKAFRVEFDKRAAKMGETDAIQAALAKLREAETLKAKPKLSKKASADIDRDLAAALRAPAKDIPTMEALAERLATAMDADAMGYDMRLNQRVKGSRWVFNDDGVGPPAVAYAGWDGKIHVNPAHSAKFERVWREVQAGRDPLQTLPREDTYAVQLLIHELEHMRSPTRYTGRWTDATSYGQHEAYRVMEEGIVEWTARQRFAALRGSQDQINFGAYHREVEYTRWFEGRFGADKLRAVWEAPHGPARAEVWAGQIRPFFQRRVGWLTEINAKEGAAVQGFLDKLTDADIVERGDEIRQIFAAKHQSEWYAEFRKRGWL